MNKPSIVKAALLGSASALGLNWIYNRRVLNKHREEGHPMIFEAIDHELYKRAKKAFDVYPDHQIGDLDFMGEVLYLFYMFLEYEEDHSLVRWREIFYEYFREDHEYNGYLESYGKEFLKRYKEESDHTLDDVLHTDFVDKQLIGPLFIFATYESEHSINKVADALNYVKTLTAYSGANELNQMFNTLLELLDKGVDKQDALREVISIAPEEYREALEISLTDISLDKLIMNHAGVACNLDQTLPVIFHIVSHHDDWADALVTNAAIGGASSARGIYVSALMSRIVAIPEEYLDKLNYNIEPTKKDSE